MSMNDKIKLHGLFIDLKPFTALSILLMFDIKAVTNSKATLIDKISFGKILILLLFNYLLNYYKLSNALVNLHLIGNY